MSRAHQHLGQEAIERKGWIGAHRYLLLRRASQLGFLGLFLLGPLFGLWIVKGTLAGSLTLDVFGSGDVTSEYNIFSAYTFLGSGDDSLAAQASDTLRGVRGVLDSWLTAAP